MKQKKIYENFVDNFNYLHKLIFDGNIYLDTYYNNLIKYFLPLPFDVLMYSPVVTFRNTDTFYKLNNIDYLDKISEYDKIIPRSYVKKKNLDMIKHEMDIHVPIKYFNPINGCIYLVATENNMLYICDIFENKMKIMYSRKNDNINLNLYKEGISFEMLHNKWAEDNRTIDLENVIYLSAYKKINNDDLFKVFGKCNFDTSEYKNLYHYTGLDLPDKEFSDLLQDPAFFALTPFFSLEGFFDDRKCLSYNIKKNIDNILDLTISIVTHNPLIKTDIKLNDDRNKKIWTYFDNNKLDYYYKNKCIPSNFNENNKCLTIKNMNIDKFIDSRPYCDINNRLYYAGRRRLQEILYKTRKYDASKIWVYDFHFDKYKKVGVQVDGSIYCSNYHHSNKKDPRICVANNDTLLLLQMGINGFFSTDYEAGYRTGGELLLTKPSEYVNLNKISNSGCSDVNAKFRKV